MAAATEPAGTRPLRPGRRRPAGGVPAPSPAQLPPEVAGFAGRTAELHWLHGLLPGFAADPAGPASAPEATRSR